MSLYDPNLKTRIDNSNCFELQSEFDLADANSDSNRARTGVGNLLLMSYIYSKMKEKNCYENPQKEVTSKNKYSEADNDFKQLESENDILGEWKGGDDLISFYVVKENKYMSFNGGVGMDLSISLTGQGYIASSYIGKTLTFQVIILIDDSKTKLKTKRLDGGYNMIYTKQIDN